MDPVAFAAARRARLERADVDLHPAVRAAIQRLVDGEDDWDRDLIGEAAVLWLEIFEAEAPEGNRGVALARFRRELASSLALTSVPDESHFDASVGRVTYWLSGYTVNSATTYGAFQRGVRYKRWVTMHDGAVREMHVATDGQIVPIGARFDVGGHNLAFPGEPVGPPDVWINCRCLAMPAARDGEVMSGTTYAIGPEDDVEEENPDIIEGYDVMTAAASEQEFTGLVLVMVPVDHDPIVAASSEPAHMTTVWMGDAAAYDETQIAEILAQAQQVAAETSGTVFADPKSRGTLGEDDADVVFVQSDSASELRERLLTEGTPIRAAHDSVEQYPEWTQHLTLGYPETPAAGDYDVDDAQPIVFDRIGVWVGGEHHDFQLGTGEEVSEMGTFDMAEVIGDADEDELVPDEPEDEDEEIITEVPIHGVAAPEGVWSGDRRMFEENAVTWRDLPVPFLYQPVSVGEHNQSVVTGRIDRIWRDGNLIRYDGAVVLNRPHANEVIQGIIDGTVRGVSVDVDDIQMNVGAMETEMNEAMAEFESSGIARPDPEIYSGVRIAGLTGVAIPAFQEGYIALGHTDEEGAEGVEALAACGCLVAGEVETEELEADAYRDVSTEERKRRAEDGTALPDGSFPIADCEDLRNAIQAIGRASDPDRAKAHIRKRKSALGCEDVELPDTWAADLIAYALLHPAEGGLVELNSQDGGPVAVHSYAPGTKDGPGWITHPIPTARIRRYWVRGKGAAKIRWGAPGDFNRCRRQLVKYVQNPDWLAGLCANMHKEALGFWPAQHRGKHALTASAERAPIFSLTAAATEVYPREWFDEPAGDRAFSMTIEKDTRRTYGYIAEWGTCHLGIDGLCSTPPPSMTDYAYFRKGIVDTTEGELSVGTITYGIGHASLNMRAHAATAHYDRTDAVRAYVNVGENAYGIWFSGVLAPWVTDEDVRDMRAIGALSGDWRDPRGVGQLDLIAAVVVNTPAFAVRPALAASAGKQSALIAAGFIPKEAQMAANVNVNVALDAETMAGIVRASVEEFRHQEKVAATVGPIRQKVRAAKLAAARARVERG